MTEKALFYVLTPEGAIPPDTFVLADEQPKTIRAGCVLVVHQASGRLLTVHGSRLIPVGDVVVQVVKHKPHVCLKCGKVEGVVLDQVTCPRHGVAGCGLLEIKR